MFSPVIKLSELLTCMSQPARIQILLGIGTQEACVCHLEAALGMSQASISQHLMILRKSNLVVTRRDGRHIFYSLGKPALLDVYKLVAITYGIDLSGLENLTFTPIPDCPCPQCNTEADKK